MAPRFTFLLMSMFGGSAPFAAVNPPGNVCAGAAVGTKKSDKILKRRTGAAYHG